MADLAKTRTPIGARTRGTRNRAYTMPNRRDTRAPGLEVNAPLVGPNASKAQRLSEILGVAKNAGNSLVNYLGEKEAEKRDEDRSQGLYDASTGAEMDEDGSKSYANAYYGYRGKEMAIGAITSTQDRLEALLNDDEADPTIEDVEAIIDEEYRAAALDEEGQPLFMGNPVAQRALGGTLAEARIKIMGNALTRLSHKERVKTAQGLARSYIYDTLNAPIEVPEAPEGSPAEPAVATFAEQFDRAIDGKGDSSPIETTGRLPVGDLDQITSNYQQHKARGSSGIDIDGQIGDPIQSPASGTIKTIGEDGRSGKFIVVSHGKDANGKEIVSTYSHLDDWDVEEGDVVQAGAVIGKMGNTGTVRSSTGGDGSHLHYRVKVGGKDVNPLEFTFGGTSETVEAARAAGLNEVDIQWAEAQGEGSLPMLDVEGFIAQLPTGFDKKLAKEQFIEVLMTTAQREGRPNLLEAAANSVRDDGTPSFAPAEERKLRSEADALRSNIRTKRKQAEAELQNENVDKLRLAILNDEGPSMASIQEAAGNGQIPPEIGLWYENYLESREDRERVRLDREEAEAREQSEAALDSQWASEAARLRLGGAPAHSRADLLEMFESGQFGVDELGNPSVDALRRLNTVLTARSTSASVRASNPATARVLKTFEENFRPYSPGGQSNAGLAQYLGGAQNTSGSPLSPPNYAYALSLIEFFIEAGDSPQEALGKAETWAKAHVADTEADPSALSDAALRAEEQRLMNKSSNSPPSYAVAD